MSASSKPRGSRIRQGNIFVRDLHLSARLGVYPPEEHDEQPIRLNIEVGTPILQQAIDSGRLADTIDYVGIVAVAREVVGRRHYRLVETLAHTIAHELLLASDASWVRVRLDKIGCLRSAKAAGVEVVIDRDDAIAHPEPIGADELRAPEQVVIVGGGVAGFAAALWVRRLGRVPLLVDSAERLGGQLHLVHRPMPDVPGIVALTGAELARQLWHQFDQQQGRWLRMRVEQLQSIEAGVVLEGTGPADERLVIEAEAVIICTGLRRNQLGVPGERRLDGRGVLHTASRSIERLKGQRVVVVGGGDSACENALMLAAAKASVTLVHRGEALPARDQFRQRVEQSRRVNVRLGQSVRAFVGEQQLTAVELAGPTGELELLDADAALIRVGWCPNSGGLPAEWCDPRGYVQVGPHGAIAGEQRAFAAGDIVDPLCPSVAVSMGQGATAAKAACALFESEPATRERGA